MRHASRGDVPPGVGRGWGCFFVDRGPWIVDREPWTVDREPWTVDRGPHMGPLCAGRGKRSAKRAGTEEQGIGNRVGGEAKGLSSFVEFQRSVFESMIAGPRAAGCGGLAGVAAAGVRPASSVEPAPKMGRPIRQRWKSVCTLCLSYIRAGCFGSRSGSCPRIRGRWLARACDAMGSAIG